MKQANKDGINVTILWCRGDSFGLTVDLAGIAASVATRQFCSPWTAPSEHRTKAYDAVCATRYPDIPRDCTVIQRGRPAGNTM